MKSLITVLFIMSLTPSIALASSSRFEMNKLTVTSGSCDKHGACKGETKEFVSGDTVLIANGYACKIYEMDGSDDIEIVCKSGRANVVGHNHMHVDGSGKASVFVSVKR